MRDLKTIKFARTVKADMELAKLCPNNSIKNLKAYVSGGDTPTNLQHIMNVIVVLSQAYEEKKHFEDPSYEMNPITYEELLYYSEEEVLHLSNIAFIDFNEDGKTTIEAEPKKASAE